MLQSNPVLALICSADGATPHWMFSSRTNRRGACPQEVIDSLRCGGALDGQPNEDWAFGRHNLT